MPRSPFKRAVEQGLNQGNQGDGSSVAGSGKAKAKRKSKPTGKKRASKQAIKKAYSIAREEAQLAGVIPTTPEGAVKPERVDPARQVGAALPDVVREALREGWATPDSAKPAIIAALLEPFFQDDIILDQDGKQVRVKPSRKMLMELAKTLRMLDQTQWERDHPVEAGKAKGGSVGSGGTAGAIPGGTTNIYGDVVQNNITTAALIRGMIERGELGILEGVQPPDQPGSPGSGGYEREVEGSTASEDNQQRAGECLEDTE